MKRISFNLTTFIPWIVSKRQVLYYYFMSMPQETVSIRNSNWKQKNLLSIANTRTRDYYTHYSRFAVIKQH